MNNRLEVVNERLANTIHDATTMAEDLDLGNQLSVNNFLHNNMGIVEQINTAIAIARRENPANEFNLARLSLPVQQQYYRYFILSTLLEDVDNYAKYNPDVRQLPRNINNLVLQLGYGADENNPEHPGLQEDVDSPVQDVEVEQHILDKLDNVKSVPQSTLGMLMTTIINHTGVKRIPKAARTAINDPDLVAHLNAAGFRITQRDENVFDIIKSKVNGEQFHQVVRAWSISGAAMICIVLFPWILRTMGYIGKGDTRRKGTKKTRNRRTRSNKK